MIVDSLSFSKVWIVIAAYNESAVIKSVLNNLLKIFPNVIVVDDCSTDDTRSEVSSTCALLVSHPVNLGQGAALQTGIDFALDSGAEVIVTFDADGQHRVSDAVSLVKGILIDEADIICGSRFLGVDSVTMPISKKFLLICAALFTRLTTGIKVTDAHNGLRAMSKKAASQIQITQNRMAHASEIISQIGVHKLRYKEYPVVIEYTKYSLAKGQKIHNAVNILIDLLLGRISK